MNYEDIIHLPHHVSKRHPQMSLLNRAAQFAPFSALSNYHDAIHRATMASMEDASGGLPAEEEPV